MDKSLTIPESPVDRIERFQSLQSGYYWRATSSILKEGIDEGMVLLIESIKWVDDVPHTVVLRPHPEKIGTATYLKIPQEDGSVRETYFAYSHHKFLVKDFLNYFEFEPDYQRIRDEELARIQSKIQEIQHELLESQTNPTIMNDIVEAELSEQLMPSETIMLGNVSSAISTGITADRIDSLKQLASREYEIASIKSKWIQSKTTAIAETIRAMTPFYDEKAAAALAQTEDVKTYVSKLMSGIASLDLYVGKDVEVETIRAGLSAASTEPLTIMQKKLMMDEELAVWSDINERFDFNQEAIFFEAIQKHDSLIDQIFPTQRCVLVMATTRNNIDYGDAWVSEAKNRRNKQVFLLIRDGLNVYRVFSPIESHLGSSKLFPSKDDQDRLFKGYNGSQIKFEDVAYSDKLSDHDKFALHYKRFLLLMCGLDHRLKLFGDFYDGDQSLDFVSMEFQEKHCRFIHDDDGTGLLPGDSRISVKEWIAEKNSHLRSGSRVLCNFDSLINPTSAPSAFHSYNYESEFNRAYEPKNNLGVAIAYRSADNLCVNIEVSGTTRKYENRSFDCKVLLQKNDGSRSEGKRKYASSTYADSVELAFLCLDNVSPEELHWYIHNRGTRRNHVFYIRFFKAALTFIQSELEVERDTRNKMAQALLDGKLTVETGSIVQQAVVAWRAANRGKALPEFNGETKEWKSILDQMYMLVRTNQSQVDNAEQLVKAMGYEPLRLVLSGNAKLVIYAAPKAEEMDNRLEPHCWMHKIILENGKNGVREKSRTWAILPKSAASETTIHEWPNEVLNSSIFTSFEQKQRLFAATDAFQESLNVFLKTPDTEDELDDYSDTLDAWIDNQKDILPKNKYVKHPTLTVPFGLVYYRNTSELKFICIGSSVPHVLLYRRAPDEASREIIRKTFVNCYYDKEKALTRFNRDIEISESFVLMETSRPEKNVFEGINPIRHNKTFLQDLNPSMDSWYSNWKAEVSRYSKSWDIWTDKETKFDSLLGIVSPEYPVYIFEFENRGALKYKKWVDICPKDVIPELTTGSRMGPAFSPSKEAALNTVRVKHGNLVLSTELSDADQPQEGVERWYVI